MPLRRLTGVVAGSLVAGLVPLLGASPAAAATTTAYVAWDPTGRSEQAQPLVVTGSAINSWARGYPGEVDVTVLDADGRSIRQIGLRTPDGQPFEVGRTYEADDAGNNGGRARLSWWNDAGNGGCSAADPSRFTVLEYTYDDTAGEVTSFAATFDAYCLYNGSRIHGALLVNSSIAAGVPLSLSFDGPGSTPLGDGVSLVGTLIGPDGPLPGRTVSISRTDPSGTTSMPSHVTDANGQFTLAEGNLQDDVTYRATSAGQNGELAAWAVHRLDVVKTTSVLTLNGPTSADPDTAVTVDGLLTDESGALAGRTVQVRRTDEATYDVPFATVVTDANGAFSFDDQVHGSSVQYKVTFAGDANHEAVSEYHGVSVLDWYTGITLTGPNTARTLTTVTLSGTVTSTGAPVDGGTVAVSRQGVDYTTRQLGNVVTDSAGHFTIAVPVGVVDSTIRFQFLGDDTHLQSEAYSGMHVTKRVSTIALKAPAAAALGQRYTITGVVKADGAGVYGRRVLLQRIDLSGFHETWVKTGTGGKFSLPWVVTVGGTVTWHAGVDETDKYSFAQVLVKAEVARRTTTLSIRPSAAAYTYGTSAVITLHLGTTFNGRTVQLLSRPYGSSPSTPATLVASGKVSADGTFTARAVIRGRMQFTARFLGDYRYLPATKSVVIGVNSKVTMAVSQYAGRSGSYFLVARSGSLVLTPRVLPSRAGSCVPMEAQTYSSGAWRTTNQICAKLDASSYAHVRFIGNGTPGLTRVRASMGASATVGAGSSPWVYVKFV